LSFVRPLVHQNSGGCRFVCCSLSTVSEQSAPSGSGTGFFGFRPSRSGDDRPDATKNPSDATTQSTAVRARVDEPLFSPSALKSASTPNDVLAVSNVSQFELEPSAQPNHPAMNSVAPSAPQPDGIQAQPQVSSASLNASTSAAVPNALPFPINDIAAAAAHYLKTQLQSVAPSSFSTLGPPSDPPVSGPASSPKVSSTNSHPKRNIHKGESGPKKKQKRKDLLTPAAQAEVKQILQKSKPGCCTASLADAIPCTVPACGRRWHAECVNGARYPKELHYTGQVNWKCPVCMTCGCCNRVFTANKRKFLKCKNCVLSYLVGRGHTQYCVCCGGDIE